MSEEESSGSVEERPAKRARREEAEAGESSKNRAHVPPFAKVPQEERQRKKKTSHVTAEKLPSPSAKAKTAADRVQQYKKFNIYTVNRGAFPL